MNNKNAQESDKLNICRGVNRKWRKTQNSADLLRCKRSKIWLSESSIYALSVQQEACAI